jgi:hypothetical protein
MPWSRASATIAGRPTKGKDSINAAVSTATTSFLSFPGAKLANTPRILQKMPDLRHPKGFFVMQSRCNCSVC